MRTPIAAGNWKLNYGPRQGADFAQLLRAQLSSPVGVECVVLPPYLTIPAVQHALRGSIIQVGAQDVSDQLGGAYTGEVAAPMIAEVCSWVIIGNSERRKNYGDTDDLVNRKTANALQAGLQTIE